MTAHSLSPGARVGLTVLAWAWVAVPFAYGVYELMLKVAQLFAE